MATKNLSEIHLDSSIDPSSYSILVISSEWNPSITKNLSKGCLKQLEESGVKDITHKWVPGTYELPSAAQFALEANSSFDAIICIGCVIQGQTKHFDFVCEAASQGVKDVSLKYNKPVIFCVLTDNNEQQSIDRSGGKLGNKGIEAAASAIKMVHYQKGLKGPIGNLGFK